MLVPVPDTPTAARARYGDHLSRLTRHCARRLRAAGWPVRVHHAASAFRARSGRGPAVAGSAVVLLDDIVTTGATLAAVSRVLTVRGLSPYGAAVLAATRKRHQQ